MAFPDEPIHFDIQSHRSRPRPEWGRAIRAVRELVRNPERTQLAFDVSLALDPDMHERALRRMLAHPEGRRVYRERPSLQARLTDRDALAALPDGSFGRAYLAHVERYHLDPAKLLELGDSTSARQEGCDPDVLWMRHRSSFTHDLWHVLTGYGADHLGEATLLLFSLAQTGGRANALLALGANLRTLRAKGWRWLPYAWRAWRRGRRATCLAALPYEELLPLPLEGVRRAAGIEAPERAHPTGIEGGDLIAP